MTQTLMTYTMSQTVSVTWHLVVSVFLSVAVPMFSIEIRVDMTVAVGRISGVRCIVSTVVSWLVPIVGTESMNIDSGASVRSINLSTVSVTVILALGSGQQLLLLVLVLARHHG